MLRSFVARRCSVAAAFLACLYAFATASASEPSFVVVPAEATLEGNFARLQLLALRPSGGGEVDQRSDDATTQATYESSDTKVVTVSDAGQLLAVGNGTAKVTVKLKGDLSARLEAIGMRDRSESVSRGAMVVGVCLNELPYPFNNGVFSWTTTAGKGGKATLRLL